MKKGKEKRSTRIKVEGYRKKNKAAPQWMLDRKHSMGNDSRNNRWEIMKGRNNALLKAEEKIV